MNLKHANALFALLLALCAGPLWALPGDKQKPVELEADQVEIDEHQGISVYRGHVVLVQGSIHMQADVMTVHTAAGRLAKVTLEGEPATYRWQPQAGKPEVQAEGARIVYDAGGDEVVMTGNAKLRQSGNTFASERIVYDAAHDKVKAGGRQGQDGKKERVKIIFQPGTAQ